MFAIRHPHEVKIYKCFLHGSRLSRRGLLCILNLMINFFWPLLDLYDDPDFLAILCIFTVAFLPHLLGFLFALFYEKFRLKKLWLSLWSVLLCALICGYVIFVYKADEDIMVENFVSIAMPFLVMLLYIAFFFACSLIMSNLIQVHL